MDLSGFLLASDAAFGIVFGIFVLALLVLAIIAIRWGVRKDRPGRQAWKQRHLDAARGNGRQPGSRPADHREDQ
jgi:O-antigen/teichoic acid export membrane protein